MSNAADRFLGPGETEAGCEEHDARTTRRDDPVRPRLLDLFCGAGGAAMGYSRAGFDVVGVDIKPQPNFPFEFVQADAIQTLLAWGHRWSLHGFGAIHASPPCQAHSTIAKQARKMGWTQNEHPDLVAPTRELLKATGLPYVIENVPGAPLETPIQLCGSSFGLNVQRHRLFELGGFSLLAPPCAHHWQTPRFPERDPRRVGKYRRVVPVNGGGQHDTENLKTVDIKPTVGVYGHLGNYPGERELRERAMGIDWMSPYELTQAIPPAYTEFIGQQLLAHLKVAA